MNREIKYIDDSVLEKAVEKDMDAVLSGVNKQKLLDEMVDNAINGSRITPTVPRKKRNGYKSIVAIAACAVICAFGITGGVLNGIDNTKQTSPPSTVANGVKEDEASTNKAVETKTVKKKVVPVENKTKKQDASKVKTGKAVLSGGQCECNHLNPQKIELTKANIKSNTCKYTISTYKDNEKVYEGKGTVVTTELTKLLTDKKDGDYLITFSYKDKKDNSIKVHEAFTINSGEILPGQYS